MEPKDYLRQMIDNTINGDTEAAEKSFKSYIVPKTIEVLGINTNSPAVADADAPAADAPAAEIAAEIVADAEAAEDAPAETE